jgi:hypothetical protein
MRAFLDVLACLAATHFSASNMIRTNGCSTAAALPA